MERIEQQDREKETNEGIPKIVLEKSKSKQVCDQRRGGEESTREIKNR